MNENERNDLSIFSGINDAINKNRRRTPKVENPGTTQPAANDIVPPKGGGGVENIQQQFLDWQVNKIAHDLYTRTIYYDTDRINAYQDFRSMDMSPEIAAALNIIRDECITIGEKGKILDIFSENSRVKTVLEDLFYNRLDIDFALKLWIRDLLKYGDFFLHLHIDKEEGIYDVMTLPSEEIHREEGYEGKTDNVRFRWETTGDYFEDWQVAHFRLLEDTRKLPYGRSILDPARKLWKQLQLAEDSMLVYRITRAPERRVFYVDVGNLEHADVGQFIQQFQIQLKKQPMVDQKTGNFNLKYNPMNVTEDYFIPMRADRSSRIETLPGACLALDTRIPLLDGRTLELKEIIQEWDEGNKNMWVYSCDPKTGKLAPGIITWAGETRKDAKTLNITLDNGEVLTTTPDHKWVHRTKGFVEARHLSVGDSLMPFYKDKKKIIDKKYSKPYECVWDSEKQEWAFTHRMVAGFMKKNNKEQYHIFEGDYEKNKMRTIHHMDNNRFNNDPDNLFFMDSRDHYRYHRHDLWSTDEKANENKKKIKKGINNFIQSQTEKQKEKRNIQSIKNLETANQSLKELMKDSKYKEEFYKKISKSLKKVRGTKKARNRQSEIAKKQWKNPQHKEKVFKVRQTLIFTDKLYSMFFEMFKKYGKADLTLEALNSQNDFLKEFRSKNLDIRSSLTNLKEFTHNHLEKMLKERGFKNYREWCKITAEKLGYKNVRAWRYYIKKEQNKNKKEFYNHKIISIEVGEIQNTGTITVDGGEMLHNYHTFATEAGNFLKNSNLGDIQDIEYLQNKLFASLQVPKNYLNYGESLPGGSTLSQQDLRFARTINTIQQAILAELRRVANIHLYFNGFKDDIDNFTVTLNNPSTQQELLKLETIKARLEVFKEMFSADATSPVSYVYAMENILGFSKNEIKLILKQKKVEKKIFAEIDSAVEMYKKIGLFKELDEKYEIEGAEEMMAAQQSGEDGDEDLGGGGGGFGGLGGDMGGADDLDIGDADIGGEGGEEAGGEESGGEEPIAERFIKKQNKYVDSLINELLGPDEKTSKPSIDDNALVKRANNMKFESEKLINSIQTGLSKRGVGKEVIQEIETTRPSITQQANPLISGSEGVVKDNDELIGDIERYLKNRKK